MASSDRDAPARVNCSVAAKSPIGSLRRCVPVVVISSFAVLGATQCRAQEQTQKEDQQEQSVAEAARQERARKQTQQKKTKHVYTAEDLKRSQILTPEDRAQLEARKNQQPPSPANAPQPSGGVEGSSVAEDSSAAAPSEDSAHVPLGDVARRFRKQKESQQLQRGNEFHLPFAEAPVLASPKPPAQPLLPPVVMDPPITVVKPAPRVVVPVRPFVKRSPFERPRVLPPPPISTPHTIVPAPRTLASLPPAPHALRAPSARVVPSPSISGKLAIVVIKPGDSLWKFAASRLGDGRRWQELLAFNPAIRNPDLLAIGSQIVVPASLAAPRAPTKYSVRHGDSLWSIAEIQLGHGAFWSCIALANPDLRDANLLREGQVLLLPSSCSR